MRIIYCLVSSFLFLASCTSNNGTTQSAKEGEMDSLETMKSITLVDTSSQYPILRTWEYAKQYADEQGVAYEVKDGSWEFVSEKPGSSIVLVRFTELVRDSMDESNAYTLEPVIYEIDLTKTCFLICKQGEESSVIGDVQVSWDSTKTNWPGVRIYVTKGNNLQYPLILVAQEELAG